MKRIKAYFILVLMVSVFTGCLHRHAMNTQQESQANKVEVKSILINGVVLKKNQRLNKILASNKNKTMTEEQLEAVLDQIKECYAQEGYGGLLDFSYSQVKGHVVIKTVLVNS